jgi:hypothetical protein
VTVIVRVPFSAAPVPAAVAVISPKLMFDGEFTVVDAAPANERVAVLPPAPKVTSEVPLPVHGAHVNTPDVLNCTGSAYVDAAVNTRSPTTSEVIREVLRILSIENSFSVPWFFAVC